MMLKMQMNQTYFQVDVLEWLATLKVGDPEWDRNMPFEWEPRLS